MARALRLALAGELHYLLQRGHSGSAAFADDTDRTTYLAMLREAAAKVGVAIHAYCLLESEVHLLATPARAESIGRLMQSLGRRYVAWFNRRHGCSGTLWQGRFRAGLVDGEALGLHAMLWVELQPALGGVIAAAADWPWSSAAHHLGRRRDPLVTEHSIYWLLGNTPFEREYAYTHKLLDGVPGATGQRIDRAVMLGRAVGTEAFSAHVERQTGCSQQAKPRGRPARRKSQSK